MSSGDKGTGTGSTTSRTRVDLGDDLLDKTRVGVPKHQRSNQSDSVPKTREQIDDQYESAKILVSEGLLDEAKKILHRVLLADPHHVAAHNKLEELRALELKILFSDARPRRRHRPAETEDVDLASIDSEEVIRKLDEDLGLGIIGSHMSLFQDPASMAKFSASIDRDLADLTPRDRMDVGVAFYEMGLFDLACRQFELAARDSDSHAQATVLLAQTLVDADKPFEATLKLEPILEDAELTAEQKLDSMYLMARAYEQMNRTEQALQWYAQVSRVDSNYRDIPDRLKRILRKRQ